MAAYPEYDIRFPLTGGELHYVIFVWVKRKLLLTYGYSTFFFILSGSQANPLVFGKSVLLSATPESTSLDLRLQKLFAILLIAAIYQLQASSRINCVRFSNLFGAYKISFFSIIVVLGRCALRNKRTKGAAAMEDLYGTNNLKEISSGTTHGPYPIEYRVYENANFVLEEVRRPSGRRDKILSLRIPGYYLPGLILLHGGQHFAVCCLLYGGVESFIGYLGVVRKVFGPSPKTRTASGTLLAISADGNITSATYSAVIVKQEIARLKIIPFPAFFAKSTGYDTPGPALLLYFIFSTVSIIATPLSIVNGYLVFGTMLHHDKTLVGSKRPVVSPENAHLSMLHLALERPF